MLRTVRLATLSAAASIVIVLASLTVPLSAYASEEPLSPCVATDEQRTTYAEDGTLEERTAFQEGLDNDEPTAGLIQQAIAREQASNGIATNAVPGNDGGMATVGKAHVLALRVSFPDKKFEAGDTLEALQALIGPRNEGEAALPSAGPYPYESLHAYYQRASYGTLTITGEAVDYEAQHERDYYTANIGQLYKEALDHLEASGVDLAQFDANGDGRIDAVYLHFAGADTGWGSVWWSNEQVLNVPDTTYANGTVQLWNAVALANPCDTAWAAQTMIHETGHVLGLPDYYQYASQQGGSTGRTGILTFDIMMLNQGDHNGFSKWMLGWLPESKITRVFANEDGIDVKRDGAVVQHVDPAEDGSSSVEQALAAFTSDDLRETGGIIVVANEDESMFSSYYLLQYDQFASNQSVYYGGAQGTENIPLPSGFRLYRVQAEVGSGGNYLVHSNAYGTTHDQLIELVDPDMSEPHTETDSLIPSAIGSDEYGCMLYEGDGVSPQGYPSTNFYENANVGFTGLTISVTESEAAQGTVAISYSNADKPADPVDFTLTPTFDAVSNVCTLTFEASLAPKLTTPLPAATQLIVDGQHHALYDIAVDGTTVSLSCLLDAGSIGPSSTCEIVFPAGLFTLSRTSEGTTYSPEIRLPLKADASLTAVSRSGAYQGTEYTDGLVATSNVFTSPNGTKRFFQIADGTLRLHTLDADDPARVTSRTIEGVSIPATIERASINVTPLSDTSAFAIVSAQYGPGTGYWIDLESGTVTASHPFEQTSMQPCTASGTTVLVVTYHYGPERGQLVTALTPREDGSVQARYGWTNAQSTASVDAGTLAFGFANAQGDTMEEARIVPTGTIVEALRDGATSPEDAPLVGELCTPERAEATLPLHESRALQDVQRAGARYYALMGPEFSSTAETSNLLIRFDDGGVEQARADVKASGSAQYQQLSVARYGTVALAARTELAKPKVTRSDVLFCDANLQPLSTLTTASNGVGAWLDDGSWLSVGLSLEASSGPKGSPEEAGAVGATEGGGTDDRLRVIYAITEQLDKEPAKPDDPDDPAKPEEPAGPGEDPQPLPKPDGAGDDAAHKLAPTGDPTGPLALAALVATLVAGGALARKRSR